MRAICASSPSLSLSLCLLRGFKLQLKWLRAEELTKSKDEAQRDDVPGRGLHIELNCFFK